MALDKSTATQVLRIGLAILSGWLAWSWFVNLFAMGEAALAGPIPLLTKVLVWATLAVAALTMLAVGLLSRLVPWGLCVLATIYPALRLAGAGSGPGILTVGGFIFLIFLVAAWLGVALRGSRSAGTI